MKIFTKKFGEYICVFIAIIPAIVAAAPLFGSRFIPTHDGEYHIIRFWQFYTMLSHGTWFPRWAPDLNFGFGIPVFTFNYPFPNYIGSLFHLLGFSFVDSVKWTLAAGYVLAIGFCFLWLRKLFGRIPAIVGTIVGSFVPYWFVDIYIRGSVGEVWALAWVFATLFSVTSGHKLLIVLSMVLLIISHNILALVFTPILFIYVLLLYRKHVIEVILGIGTASYFWIPALYEQRFITGLSYVNMFDYFPALYQLLVPSWGSGFRGQVTGGNEMSYQIGIAPTLVFLIAVWGVLSEKIKSNKEALFFVVCFVIACFLMVSWSVPIWRIVPFTHFIQYPWRLLSVVIVATAVLAAFAARRFRIMWIIVSVAILAAYGYSRPVMYEPRPDPHYLEQASFTSGTSSLGNAFQTKWMTREISQMIREFTFSDIPVRAEKITPTQFSLSVIATKSGTFVAPIAYYPGWKASVDGRDTEVLPNGQGLIFFSIPKGNHEVRIWLGSTWWQRIGAVISGISLFITLVSYILRKRL